MATRKRPLTQAQKSAIPKLSRLKKLGLFGGNVRRPSRYAIKQTKTFGDVLSGNAAVVNAPTRKDAREYSGVMRVRKNKIVVPKDKGERVTYDKKEKAIVTRREAYGTKVKTVKPSKSIEPSKLPKKGVIYVIPFGAKPHQRRYRFTSFNDLVAFMKLYEIGERPFADWRQYVELEYTDNVSGVTSRRNINYLRQRKRDNEDI